MLDQLKFPYPMFLTTWHMVFATIMTQILSRTTNMLPGVREVSVVDFLIFLGIVFLICYLISFVLFLLEQG